MESMQHLLFNPRKLSSLAFSCRPHPTKDLPSDSYAVPFYAWSPSSCCSRSNTPAYSRIVKIQKTRWASSSQILRMSGSNGACFFFSRCKVSSSSALGNAVNQASCQTDIYRFCS